MYAYISARNHSQYPVITVFVNDILYFKDLLTESSYKPCNAGSVQVTVLDNREKTVYDIYLATNPGCRYILELYPDGYIFKPVGIS